MSEEDLDDLTDDEIDEMYGKEEHYDNLKCHIDRALDNYDEHNDRACFYDDLWEVFEMEGEYVLSKDKKVKDE